MISENSCTANRSVAFLAVPMSDDESPEAPPAEEAPRRKKRARPVSSEPAAKAPVRAAVVAPAASQWTTGHIGAALALGLALGGAGGYLFASKSGPSATAESGKGAQSGAAGAKQPPAPGAYVPLAAWTPREGPEQAKVTIVEFSDFQ